MKSGIELSQEQIKKLRSIERRMKSINEEIRKMGFKVYLSNDTVNIMNGPSHDDSRSVNPLRENSIWSFYLRGWTGGDW